MNIWKCLLVGLGIAISKELHDLELGIVQSFVMRFQGGRPELAL